MARKLVLLKALLALFAVSSAAPTTQQDSVDYAIVGAGPAGYVIAERLTRNPRISVVLLEAGPDADTDPLVTSKLNMGSGRDSRGLYLHVTSSC